MVLKGRTPTKEEKEWMDKITQAGCIVCWLHHGIPHSQCSVHHISGKTKKGAHLNTIGLCYRHHQDESNNPMWISRHKNKFRFEERYGTEEWLLEKTKEYLKIMDLADK